MLRSVADIKQAQTSRAGSTVGISLWLDTYTNTAFTHVIFDMSYGADVSYVMTCHYVVTCIMTAAKAESLLN